MCEHLYFECINNGTEGRGGDREEKAEKIRGAEKAEKRRHKSRNEGRQEGGRKRREKSRDEETSEKKQLWITVDNRG